MEHLTVLLLVCALGMGAMAVALFFAWRRGSSDLVETYPQPDFSSEAGFRITALPSASFLQLESIQLINRRIAQLTYRVDPSYTAIFRVAEAGVELDYDELPQNYATRKVLYLYGTRVVWQSNPGGPSRAEWSRDGFNFLLYFPQHEMGLQGGLLDDFVRDVTVEKS